MAKMRVAQVPRPNGPFELVEGDIPEPPAAGCESRCRAAVFVTASQVDGRKMMARRIVYGLFPGVAILLAVGAALGQGMQTFTNEQAARGHCPADSIVWLNTSTANYHFKDDPWYGRTQRGSYVCKVEADKDGMRAWTSPK